MSIIDETSAKYIDFQATSISPFHVVEKIENTLLSEGFQSIDIQSPWDLREEKYFVIHPDKKSAIAFVLGKDQPSEVGFAITLLIRIVLH